MASAAPQHGAIFAKTLAQDLLSQGLTEQEVFDGAGLEPDILNVDRPVAGFDKIATFFEHASVLTGNDTLGFERGQKRETRRAGIIAYVGVSSPTVLDYIENTARFRRVFSDAVEVDCESVEVDGIVKWYFAVPSTVQRRQFVEFSASGLMNDLRRAANSRFRPEQVTFRHARNSNTARFERYFGCPVRFGAPENSYRFKAEDLALPLMTADDELYSILRNCCEKTLADKARNIPPVIVEVERRITDVLSRGEATQECVAKALGMSPRTLSRRLAGEGTTFFQTLDGLRRSLAETYLRDSNLALSEISFLLGYSGLSSFSDAFKRWTGTTPGQFRAS